MPQLPPVRMSVQDVADHWRVTDQHVRNLVKAGKLPAIKIGRVTRIRPEDVARFEDEGPAPWGDQSSTDQSSDSSSVVELGSLATRNLAERRRSLRGRLTNRQPKRS